MKESLRILLAIVLALTAAGSGAGEAQQPDRCPEFLALGWPGASLQKYGLDETFQRGAQPGEERIYNVDVDGDDVADVIDLSCASSIPRADPCTVSIELSAGGKLEFKGWHVLLFRHRGKLYAATSGGAEAPREPEKIVRVGPKFISTICSR